MKKYLLSILAATLSATGFAQTAASYSFTSTTGTYSSISGTGTALTGAVGDDMTATGVPIGFSFSFCGAAHTTVSVCSNGWVSFASTSATAFNNMLSSLTTISPVLMPFWCDLNGTGGSAYYQTTGTTPNRIFTIEYNNWSYYPASGSHLNFQVKLHETTNAIDYCYGTNSFATSSASVIGIATGTTDYKTVDSGVATSSIYYNGITAPPASGTIYSWNATPAGCSGTPAAGTATASLTSSCPSMAVSLALAAYTSGTGITYQWQSSTDAITWTNISGATTTSATSPFTATSPVYYHCVSTCAAGPASATSPSVTVAPNVISGTISFTGVADSANKVWLIYYNPADSSLTAIDSTISCASSTSTQYYQFDNEAAGTYMVKAKDVASVPGTSGNIPTYSLSTPYWGTAATAAHTTGYDVLNINMLSGTVPSGPGFIGGLIVSGAGKHTTSDVPVVGMLVYLKNASGNILTYTYTNASGNYSFTGIANGTYTIYPEDMGFVTTPSANIVLNSGYETANNINFKEHTTARTVTPIASTAGVALLPMPSCSVYPNPASNDLNISWIGQATNPAAVEIKNIVGSVVYRSNIDMSNTSGNAHFDISALSAGIYFVSLRSENMNYSVRLVVQK